VFLKGAVICNDMTLIKTRTSSVLA